MSTLTILPSGKTVEAIAGTNLLQAILDAGEKLVSKCGGEAKCGACHIFLTGGRKGVSKMTPAGNAKLDTAAIIHESAPVAKLIAATDWHSPTVELLGALSG